MEDNDEEELGEKYIELPKEFKEQGVQACSIVELLTLFKKSENNKNRNYEENEIVAQTRKYVLDFNKYGLPEDPTIKACKARGIFTNEVDNFTKFEITQLIDLVPGNAKEAFSLIPSLKNKISEENLDSYLEELNKESEK